LFRREPQPGAELCAVAELLEVANGGYQRGRGDGTNALELLDVFARFRGK